MRRALRGKENTTSARDVVALLREIQAGPTPATGERALGLLLGQRLRSKIAVSPPGARYAHKTGEIEGVENDAEIFLLAGRSFALAFLVEGEVGRAVGPTYGTLRVICGFYAGAGDRSPGKACIGRMYEHFWLSHARGAPAVAGMRGRLDNVSMARLQCRQRNPA